MSLRRFRWPHRIPPGNRAAGILMLLAGVVSDAYFLRYLLRAFTTGTVPGKFGALYASSQFQYWVNISAAALGAAFGATCLWIGWKWIQQDP